MTDQEYTRLITGILDALYPPALTLTRCPSSAEDLLQFAAMKAWEHRSVIRADGFRAWMHVTIRNRFISIARHERTVRDTARHMHGDVMLRSYSAQRIADSDDPEGAILHDEMPDELLEHLEAITPEQRETVLLVDVQGLAYKDAAERIGCPIGTVMSRLHRGRLALRERMGARVAA